MEDDELKESLKGMIKSNDIGDTKLAIDIIKNNEEYKDLWYNINDYINKDTVAYYELYSKEGKSDKCYLVIINKHANGSFSIKSHYGRRGKTMRMTDYGTVWSIWGYPSRVSEKVAKGYKIINEWKKS